MAKNEFANMRQTIQKAVNEYERVRKECGITDAWHYESIKRLAYPFLKGHFTLAVTGKMSSGKSTFINALIGESVLPTGHFQTTSTITYIQSGPEFIMDVIYCDGHKETIKANIKERLLQLVAVPDEYSALPIYDINRLISGGTKESRILEMKKVIEDRTKCACTDVALWKKYIKEHNPSNITKEVHIQYPLPEEFSGWRIVDTPGVGAVGGIQDETKKLFTTTDDNDQKMVDAIIFLQSGTDNIEDESARTFMEEVFNQLTKDAKERMFFVLTKAAERDFRLHKEGILQRANSLYAQPYGLPSDRVTFVDSLLHKFCRDLNDKVDFGDIEILDGWSQDDLVAMTDLYRPIQKVINAREEEMTNESIMKVMKDWSNFEELEIRINDFVKKEKSSTMDRILTMIKGDCRGFIKNFQQEIKLLEGGKGRIEEERKKLVEERIGYNNVLNKLLREATASQILPKFSFIDERIYRLSALSKIELIRTDYQNLINKVIDLETDIFESIKKDFYLYCRDYVSNDVILQSIDFDKLENDAEMVSSKMVKDYKNPKRGKLIKEGGCWSGPEYEIIYPDKKVTDDAKKLREFKAFVMKEARAAKETFEKQLGFKIASLHNHIKNEVEKIIVMKGSRLTDLESQINNKESLIKDNNRKLQIIESSNYGTTSIQ